jgi:prepilin-type N-terminal cleavage/methylation domain-containing protein
MYSRFENKTSQGFTLTEMLTAVSIIGMLSAIALPNYTNQVCRSESSEAISSVGSLQTIIAAYIDETGVYPTSWDDLNSIAAIMSKDGQMSGKFTEKWILPNENYEISVSEATTPIYNITAVPRDGCEKRSISACLNTSTGASALKKGNGTTNTATAVCT